METTHRPSSSKATVMGVLHGNKVGWPKYFHLSMPSIHLWVQKWGYPTATVMMGGLELEWLGNRQQQSASSGMNFTRLMRPALAFSMFCTSENAFSCPCVDVPQPPVLLNSLSLAALIHTSWLQCNTVYVIEHNVSVPGLLRLTLQCSPFLL